jgi:putative ABC transport system permease protein
MAWLEKLRNVLRPNKLQRELKRELSFHLLERIEELQEGGMSRDDAIRTAHLQLGNYTVQIERTREMDIHQRLDTTLRNLRQAARALARAPGFTATVIVTLALGIGANSAVFSAIYAVVLRPLPFPNADRLVTLAQSNPKMRQPFVAPVRLEDWNRMNTTFQAISGYYTQDESELSGELPERLTRAFVAPRFLQVWGMAPAIGRDFAPRGRTFRRTHGGTDQRSALASPLQCGFECHRQNTSLRTDICANHRRHARLIPIPVTRRRSVVHQPG